MTDLMSEDVIAGVEPRRRPFWREIAVIVAISTVVMWTLTSVALMIYTKDARDPVVRTLVVEPGAAALIAAGENPLDIPDTWTFYDGDVLRIDNQEKIPFLFGGYLVRGKTVTEIELLQDLGGTFECNLHPSGELTLDIQPRGFRWGLTILPALILGPGLGLAGGLVRRAHRAMDDTEDRRSFDE